ncbi:MAG: hypothetical protein LBJ12_00100 [Oscillospiraceae bacterium]|jgi:hypothetical protein|nr:hypothetical protein [Oscillospiraceae bacterium]
MIPEKERYTSKLFLNAVLPLLKVIEGNVPELKAKFEGVNAVIQISAIDDENPTGKSATHFIIEDGAWTVKNDKVAENPDIDLCFKSVPDMNAFFKGDMGKGIGAILKALVKKPGLFLKFMGVLLKMSNLLMAKEAPADEATQKLLVKCFFYLLTAGISQLNKLGHEEVRRWTEVSPDRVYALDVIGQPDVAAYIRIKAGKSRSGHGVYTRAMPFFTLRFDSFKSALGILLATDDMMEATKAGRLIMDGAPEFGATFGNLLLVVGGFVQ